MAHPGNDDSARPVSFLCTIVNKLGQGSIAFFAPGHPHGITILLMWGVEDGIPGEEEFFYARLYEEIWSTMAAFNNFSYFWGRRNYTKYGDLYENGSWSGIMKELKEQTADVALCDMSITPRRLDDADFTDTVKDQRVSAFMGLPARHSLKWTDFFMPFSKLLWTAAVGAAVCLALSLAFVVRMGGQGSMAPRDAWLFVSAAFCQQGQSAPRTWSGRMLCVCAHLVALVLAAAHSGALISALFAGKEHLLFQSIEEANDNPNTQYVVTFRVPFLNSSWGLEASLIGLTHYLKSLKGEEPPFEPRNLEMICKDKLTVTLLPCDMLPYMVSRISCLVEKLPSAEVANPIAIALTKRNPYVQLFSYYVRRMRRTGVLSCVVERHKPRLRSHALHASQPAVRLGDVAPVFPAFAAGALLSLLLLALERRMSRVLPPGSPDRHGPRDSPWTRPQRLRELNVQR